MMSIRRLPSDVLRFGALAACAAVMVMAVPAAASAVPAGTIGSFPTFTVSPVPGGSTGTATFSGASNLPSASITTDGSPASAPSGQSAFLGVSTGFGAYFGSTRAQPYLSISTTAVNSPSTTVLAFSSPFPVGAGFAVGDIDADLVEIIAIGTDTRQLTGAELGAQDTGGTPLLNYCNNSPKPSSCTGAGPFPDAPTWYPTGTTVGAVTYTNPVVVGSGGNTLGAYDWFLPTRPIASLTLRFSARLGVPNYQLWLAGPAPATVISGTIAQPDGAPAPAGTSVALAAADGAPVLDIVGAPVIAPVDQSGAFSLPTEQGSYRLEFVVPTGFDPIPTVSVDATSPTAALGTITLAPTAVAPPTPIPAPAPAAAADPELANTGPDATTPAIAASAALALLAGLTLVRRRRYPSTGT